MTPPKGTVRIEDVARAAGVALSTASRVLNDHPSVRPRTRDRVLAAAEQLGYRPNHAARSLRTGRTLTIGYVLNVLTEPVLHAIRGAEQRARAEGYLLLLANSDGDGDLELAHLRAFLNGRVDGIILQTVAEPREETWQEVINSRVPVAVVDRDVPQAASASMVLVDHETGAREATEQLLRMGHTTLGHISGPTSLRPVRERVRGMRRALGDAGLALEDDLVRLGSLDPVHGRHAAESLLSRRHPPTALMVGSPTLLSGVLLGIDQAGLTIGRDIALMVFDDSELARLHKPPVSVVIADSEAVGAMAAQLLVDQVLRDAPIRTVVMPTRYAVRESSDFHR